MQYNNEAIVGRALRDFIASNKESCGRQHLFITSKIWNDCHRPKAARHTFCHGSLHCNASKL